jgi:hypothetical protein
MRLTGLSHLLAAALFAAATVPVLAADRLVLRSQVVMDTQGTGTEAFRLLVPDGWSFDGGLAWNVEKFPAEPYTAYRVVSPARDAVFEQFPHVTLFWSDDPLLQQSHAQNGIDVMQPAGAERRCAICTSPATVPRPRRWNSSSSSPCRNSPARRWRGIRR